MRHQPHRAPSKYGISDTIPCPPPPAERPSPGGPRPVDVWESIDTAAPRLALSADALRARCRRAGVRVASGIEADLGGGIVAFKFGRSWRIRFPRA